ncbi:MAG: FAD-binding oxidoreductase [Deltaproteobacteria bacterium]|nr:FAD-binding oxidoreductase [Deltaproteobacteria bacterium]
MNLPPAKLRKTFRSKIEAIVGPGGFSAENLDRFNYARDSGFKSAIRIKYNRLEPLPDIIVWPENTLQVQKLVKAAIRHRVPIVPYGAGSGVCGGTVPVKGGMIVDMKKMRKLIRLDKDNLLVEAEAGTMGLHLENELERKGYTLGHFPSSILCASLGGYLAARSAGQKSSRYGKIEDMVREMEIVTGTGEIIRTTSVSNKEGIDLNHVFLGSEGTLGLITKATLRIHPKPQAEAFRGIRFKNLKTGIEALRRMIQSGIRPAVMRLYDELDSFMLFSFKNKGKGFKIPGLLESVQGLLKSQSLQAALALPQTFQALTKMIPGGCVLILMHEGDSRIVAEEQKIAMEIASGLGGSDMGEEPGKHWYAHRYSVSYKASPLFYSGAFTDTVEVAASWDKIGELYDAMTKALSPHALVMAHLSHAYPDGGAFYFTFVAPLKGLKKSEELFDLIWDHAMETCQKVGGVISHHHGVGRLKAKFVTSEWGEGAEIFGIFKELYDPHSIMNPGKLYIPETPLNYPPLKKGGRGDFPQGAAA